MPLKKKKTKHTHDKHVVCRNIMLTFLFLNLDDTDNVHFNFPSLAAKFKPTMHDNFKPTLLQSSVSYISVLLLKVLLLCYDMQSAIWSYFPLSSLSQCSILGLELSCIKPTVRCSQMGWMGDSANNQVPRVECLCLSLNGLSHLLQRMNMRCLRCQHCKWILGL